MAAVTTFACEQCGAHLAFDGVRTARCPYCASPSFVERPAAAASPIRASSSHSPATRPGRAARSSAGSAPGLCSPIPRCGRPASRTCGSLRPGIPVHAVAHADYTAPIAEHYTEETRKRDDGTSETRTVTRTEYRPLAGRHVSYVTDVWSARSGTFARRARAGRAVRLPADAALQPGAGLGLDRGGVRPRRRRVPRREPPRGARRGRGAAAPVHARRRVHRPDWRAHIAWESLDPVLVPVWMFAVRYRGDRPPLRVAINGQTGQIAGKVPLYWPRIIAALVVLAAIALADLVGHAMTDCARCASPLEEGDLRCAVCALTVPDTARPPPCGRACCAARRVAPRSSSTRTTRRRRARSAGRSWRSNSRTIRSRRRAPTCRSPSSATRATRWRAAGCARAATSRPRRSTTRPCSSR